MLRTCRSSVILVRNNRTGHEDRNKDKRLHSQYDSTLSEFSYVMTLVNFGEVRRSLALGGGQLELETYLYQMDI